MGSANFPSVRHVTTFTIASCQACSYTHHMTDAPKPQTFQMRVSDDWLAKIDEWRRQQPDLPSRAEAIRRLVDMGLKASQ